MTAHDLDALLQHAGWLDRLSRQLTRDEHAAADAVQDTLLAATRRPPHHAANVRGFLATILRNVLRLRHRGDARRRRREGTLVDGRDDEGAHGTEGVADTVARAELQQRLGAMLLGLAEPQRSLVLQHYFDGEPVEALAARRGLSSDAVHGHLRRARDTLRRRLQESPGRRPRREAAVALVARHTLWLTTTLSIMTVKTKVAATAAVAAGLVCLWMLQPGDAPPTAATKPTLAGRSTPVTGPLAGPEQGAQVRSEAPLPDEVPGSGQTPSSARGRLTGRVVDPAGTPVCPARVYALAVRGGKPTEDHVLQDDVDELGQFAIVPTFEGDVLVVAMALQPSRADARQPAQPLQLHPGLIATAMPAQVDRQQEHALGDLQLTPSVAITGAVRGPAGEPFPGVHVGWAPADTTWGLILDAFTVSGLAAGGVHVDVARRSGGSSFSGGTATDPGGRFTIPATAGTTGYVFLMNQSGEGEIERLVPERKVTAPATVDFALLAPACVRVLTAGKPTANQIVRFEIDIAAGREPSLENYRTGADGELRILREREARLRGRILRPGREPLTFDVPADATPGNPLVVELGTVATTPVQVVLTSEVPLHTLTGTLSRLDVPPAPIPMQAKTAPPLVALEAAVPPGRYRLRLTSSKAGGNDSFVLWHTQDVTVGNEPMQVPVHVQHGGRIRIDVQSKDGQFAPGKVRLVDANGKETAPSLHAPGRGNGPGGELWAPGPLLTAQSALPPGRYEVVVDLGAHGVHRRFVDVRRCEVGEVTITLP